MNIFKTDNENFVNEIRKGNLENTIKMFKEHNVDINHIDKYGFTPLEYAIYYGKNEIFEKLIDFGAKVENPNELLNISINNDTDGYLKSGYKKLKTNRVPGFFDNSKYPERFLNHSSIITETLISKYNADHKRITNDADFLYKIATNSKSFDSIIQRKENGLNIDATNDLGKTALYLFSENRLFNKIKPLIEMGADTTIGINSNVTHTHLSHKITPFGIAISSKNQATINEFITLGVKPTPDDLIISMKRNIKDVEKLKEAKNDYLFHLNHGQDNITVSKQDSKETSDLIFKTAVLGRTSMGGLIGPSVLAGNLLQDLPKDKTSEQTETIYTSDKHANKFNKAKENYYNGINLTDNIKRQFGVQENAYVEYYFELENNRDKNLSFFKEITDNLSITKNPNEIINLDYSEFQNKNIVSDSIKNIRKSINSNNNSNNYKPTI